MRLKARGKVAVGDDENVVFGDLRHVVALQPHFGQSGGHEFEQPLGGGRSFDFLLFVLRELNPRDGLRQIELRPHLLHALLVVRISAPPANGANGVELLF
jgi:hypothetical protein